MKGSLSESTRSFIDQMFEASERDMAKALLMQIFEAGENRKGSERSVLAALKLSNGSLQDLRRAVDLYHTDFRDLLMAAGFGQDISAHLNWRPDINR